MRLDQDSVNRELMRDRRIVAEYGLSQDLSLPEAAALASIANDARGRPILDVGVGAGRTVRALRAVSEDYLGIDYTQAMVESCRKKYPDARFEHTPQNGSIE